MKLALTLLLTIYSGISFSQSLLDSQAKLIGNIYWFELGHHQNSFLIPEDCTKNSRCEHDLISQNYTILHSFITDSIKYVAPKINRIQSFGPTFEDILPQLQKAKEYHLNYITLDCEFRNPCKHRACGRGDMMIFDQCLADRKAERISYMKSLIKHGLSEYKLILKPKLTLETNSFMVKIGGACIPPAIACNDLSYTGKSKKNGSQISLTGVPYYGSNGTSIKLLGYYFNNKNIEYYVSLKGILKVYDNKSKKTLIEESGRWLSPLQ